MQTLRLIAMHLLSVGAILLAARWFVVRPAVKALKETRDRTDAKVDEMRKLLEEARAEAEARDRRNRDDVAALDKLRAAAADLLRQESRLIVEKAAEEMREKALQPFTSPFGPRKGYPDGKDAGWEQDQAV